MISGQFCLNTGDELHEERLYPEQVRRPVDDQPEGPGPAVGERAGRAVRLEADLLRDGQDPLTCRRGYTRLAVERK